jgi:hypothetical protein
MPRIAAEKMTSPLKYRHYALIVFSGPFPLDTLRYERACAYEQGDSSQIEQSLMNMGEPNTTRFAVIQKPGESAQAQWYFPLWNGIARCAMYPISPDEIHTIRDQIAAGTAKEWAERNLLRGR